jgi:hypothetical protein
MPSLSNALDARLRELRTCAWQWQDPVSEVRLQAREAFRQSEWPEAVVELALENVVRGSERFLTIDALEQDFRSRSDCSSLVNVLAIMPGNVIGPTLATAFCAAAAGATLMLKSSSRELRLAEIIAEQFQQYRQLAGTVTPMRWTGGDVDFEAKVFMRASKIIAFGDETTINDIRRRIPSKVAFVPYASAYSVGFVNEGADLNEAAMAAAGDIALFDQRGCLSPQTVYVSGNESRAILFAHALERALKNIGGRIPRARAGVAEQAAVAEFIRRLMVRALPASAHSLDTLLVGPRNLGEPDYVIGVEQFSAPVCAGFGRIVIVKPCQGVSQAAAAARSLGHKLDTVGVARTLKPADQALFTAAGARRICLLGEMQRPPLGYRPAIKDFFAEGHA